MNQKAIEIITACWHNQDPILNLSGHTLNQKLNDADFVHGSELRRRLAMCTHIKTLYLEDNALSVIRGLEGLVMLQLLRLNGNQINEIRGLEGLSALQHLFLSNNQISEIRGLEGLSTLRYLYLGGNKIKEIKKLEHLSSLQHLHLNDNQISKIKGLEHLSALKQLYLDDNQISQIQGLERLFELQVLSLSCNQINKIKGLEHLSALQRLYLGDNQINEIPGLEYLKALTILDLASNNISDISGLLKLFARFESPLQVVAKKHWKEFAKGEINIYGNPIITPPMEVVQRGNEAVIEYLEAALKKNLQPLNECKVIIVGDGAVGKTSLMKRVVYNSFDPNEPTTHGINKIAWRDIYNAKGENITVNVWDFGGQHLQHSLHQFFFSKRVLYILVLNPRTMGNAAYWMGQVEKLGGDSQVLVVFNAKDEKDTEASFATSYYELCKTYQQLSETYYTVCCANDGDTGIATFKQALTAAILAQPELATQYPTDWYNIKKAIEEKVKLRQDNFYVHYDEYIKICLANNYPDADRQKGLLVQLDDIGSIVFFDRDDINHLQVLNPEWITTGAYAILTSAITHANNGYLTMTDLSEIFKEEKAIFSDKEIKIKYETVHIRYILDLMQHYNLCQKNPFDTHTTSYLVPAALTGLPSADFSHYKQTGKHYRFEFDVKFEMIIIHRFIARNLGKAKDKEFWQSGIVIKDDNSETWALVETNQLSGVIDFWISGAEIRGFWEHIRRDMRAICKIYRNMKIEETVFYSKGGVEAFLSYEELLDYLKSDDGSLEARIRVPGHGVIKVDLLEVLENFESKESLEKMVREIRDGVRMGFAENKSMLNELLQKIDTALSNEQAAERLAALDAAINERLGELPQEIVTQWAALNSQANDGVEAKAKLKLKVPIIPFLLDYEGEFAFDMKKLGKKLRGIVF